MRKFTIRFYRHPVDRLEHPDYDRIIDTPMDLSIMREELKCDNYDSPHEFWKDLKIMFNNAKNYTPNKRTRVSIDLLCIGEVENGVK